MNYIRCCGQLRPVKTYNVDNSREFSHIDHRAKEYIEVAQCPECSKRNAMAATNVRIYDIHGVCIHNQALQGNLKRRYYKNISGMKESKLPTMCNTSQRSGFFLFYYDKHPQKSDKQVKNKCFENLSSLKIGLVDFGKVESYAY